MKKYCKFDDSPSWQCRWEGKVTADDYINCQLFTIKNTQYKLLKSFEKAKLSRFEKSLIKAVKTLDSRTFEEAAKKAADDLVKETEKVIRKLGGKKK